MSEREETYEFEMPEIEIIELNKTDVIVTSGCSTPGLAPTGNETEPAGF